MLFEWNENCVDENIRKAMLFDVIDISGNVVAREDIPFVLVKDGQFGQIDAI